LEETTEGESRFKFAGAVEMKPLKRLQERMRRHTTGFKAGVNGMATYLES
jgi:hypothetical protein